MLAASADPVLLIFLGVIVLTILMVHVLALKALNQRGFLSPIFTLLAYTHITVRVKAWFGFLAVAYAPLDEIVH